jgi:hypothetical protein
VVIQMRAVRLATLLAVHFLGLALYFASAVFGFFADLPHLLVSFIPVLGPAYWFRVMLITQRGTHPFAISFMTWAALIGIALLLGAFKEPLAPGAFRSGGKDPPS